MSSWIPFYREVVQVLARYEDRQDELINLIREVRKRGHSVSPTECDDDDNEEIELSEIDPFSFLANFHCSDDKSRLAMWRVLKDEWKLVEEVPDDLRGVPTIHGADGCFSHDLDDVRALWRLFQSARQSAPPSLDGALWLRAIQIGGIGATTMSMGLFWINPQEYLSLDGEMMQYLRGFDVKPKGLIKEDWNNYVELLAHVHEKVGRDHLHLSREAYKARDNSSLERTRRYWAGGHDWSTGSQLKRFKDNNEWQLGYSDQTGTPVAQRMIELFNHIEVGDDLAIKGSSFKNLRIYYVGRVRAIDVATRTVQLDQLSGRKLYVGSKPSGKGSGNWMESLLEVKRPEDIALIFGVQNDASPASPTFTLPMFPLNQILYGPPGTGKTYNTLSRAVEIVDGANSVKRAETVARFEKLRAENRIGFVTFHQSYAYEEFIEGLRPDIDESARGGASYNVRAGTLKTMALRALGACLELAQPESATFDDAWNVLLENIENKADYQILGLSANSSYKVTSFNSIGVVATNTVSDLGNYSCPRRYAESVWSAQDKKDSVNTTRVEEILEKGTHRNFVAAVVNELFDIAKTLSPSKETTFDQIAAARSYLDGSGDYRLKSDLTRVPRFVLIVDEINRGNISKILGELITLLEDDKRLGEENALRVILPYSGETFALPPNLYLIGTMNTADKSLALLDVALRRRFVFEEMAPDFSVCSALPPQMRAVVEELNRRLLRVLDREHRLGHAFFIKVRDAEAFNEAFKSKIVPLLQEFFYNDWEGLRAVLGEGGKGTIVCQMEDIEGVRGRNSHGWWSDLDRETPNFLKALSDNYKINQPNAVTPIDDTSANTTAMGTSDGA